MFSSSAAVLLIFIRYWEKRKKRFLFVWSVAKFLGGFFFSACVMWLICLSLLFRSIVIRILPYVWCVFVGPSITLIRKKKCFFFFNFCLFNDVQWLFSTHLSLKVDLYITFKWWKFDEKFGFWMEIFKVIYQCMEN